MASYAYLRVSTIKQTQSGAGLEAQEDACRRGRDLQGVFIEGDVSGATGLDKRPQLLAAITILQKGDELVVAKRDRIGRDPIVLAMIESAVARKGARIVSAAGEGTDDDTPTSILMRRMVDAFGEYERLMISARTKAAMQAKKARGAVFGCPAYGVKDEEMDIIRQARELRETGLSLRAVAKTLAERGLYSRKGKIFQANQISRMVS